jgi:hypothetical protein
MFSRDHVPPQISYPLFDDEEYYNTGVNGVIFFHETAHRGKVGYLLTGRLSQHGNSRSKCGGRVF